jgi:HlyD family secretion protein
MTNDRKQIIRLWFYRSSAILLVLVFFTVRALTRDRLQVRVAKAVRTELINTVPTNGRVEPEVNYEVHSPLSTTVKALYVQPGDQVAAGKLLMQLDDMQARAKVASAESGVKAAQAAVEAATHNGTLQERQQAAADLARLRSERDQARRDLEALSKLHASGAASANEVAGAQQRLDSSEASLHAAEESAKNHYSNAEIARAQASLAEAEANLAAAREILAQTVVRAPAAGTIYTLNGGPTEFVEQGKLLIQLADLHHVRVRAYFDEPEIGRLAIGQKILITWNAKPRHFWHGHIVRVPVSVIIYGTRNVGEVLVEIDDADGSLLPDTNVTVTATTSTEPNTLAVPREALYSEAGKYFVYKVVNNTLQRTPVTIGTSNLTQVAITSGLNDGDQVSTGTATGAPLQEGVPIKVVP